MNPKGATAKDTYAGFAELAEHEKADRDFQISLSDVGSMVTVVAPHGGRIEPNTSEIARRIASADYNCYCFEGIKDGNNASLHITSHHFDEPVAVDIVSKSCLVVVVHACTALTGTVYLGGRDRELKEMIAAQLESKGVLVSTQISRFQGLHPHNICNRSGSGKGVQLEIARDLRDDPASREKIAAAVRVSLDLALKNRGRSGPLS